MKLTTEDIQKEIDEHLTYLETLTHYRDALDGGPEESIVELIEDADFESDDFNIGYEQGYLAGLNSLLRLSKETVI